MFLKTLRKRITDGTLTVCMPNGQEHRFGGGAPQAEWLIREARATRRIALDPELQLGETYLAGDWDAGPSGLPALLELLMRNIRPRGSGSAARLAGRALTLLRHWNPVSRSLRNVAHHYDLDEWLFRRFLDQDLHYSCAYFEHPGMDLEAAQQAKCRHIRRKLHPEPEQRVLDIGSGWGGLAMHLAERTGARVTGLTLSREQHRVATARARERGLHDRVAFLLQDYRQHRATYDRIVSVGMFEHVGRPHFARFFRQVRELLGRDGSALLHTIGTLDPEGGSNAWIRRHIFPGGYIPSLSEVTDAAARAGLVIADVEVLRLHYAETLAAWQARFQAHRNEIAGRLSDRFCRMWEFYLASCEAAFRQRGLVVYQLQLAHHVAAVPLTRDYLYRPDPVPAPSAVAAGGD